MAWLKDGQYTEQAYIYSQSSNIGISSVDMQMEQLTTFPLMVKIITVHSLLIG
jgi:hypothetical protein